MSSAIQNSGLRFPTSQRITVNLAPADLPKDSGRFDLPIALGILAESGQLDGTALADWEFAGELSLGGELRAVRGALAMSLALSLGQAHGRLVLPVASAAEAALVPDTEVYGARGICWTWCSVLHRPARRLQTRRLHQTAAGRGQRPALR